MLLRQFRSYSRGGTQLTILELDKEGWNDGNWYIILKVAKLENQHKSLLRFMGRFMVSLDIKNLPVGLRYIKLIRNDETNVKLAQYLCGLLSSFLSKRIDLIVEDEFVLGYGEDFSKGKSGEKLGIQGVDNYLSYLRKKVSKKVHR